MQERHINRERYFEEQARTSKKYYIPYIEKIIGELPDKVLEIGCGEGGNLLPFAEYGCEIVGVDIAALRIEQARTFFAKSRRCFYSIRHFPAKGFGNIFFSYFDT